MLPSNAPEWESTHSPSQTGGARRQRGPLFTLVVLILSVGVIGFGVTQLPSANPGRPAASTASSQEMAIQQVIRGLDEAQARAIATDDPKVMAATATEEFYREELAEHEYLLASGVTEIKLIDLEWGPIIVNGNMATATAWETWAVTYVDGTTEQSRERNLYSLVQDNGTWKVQANLHPDTIPTPSPVS